MTASVTSMASERWRRVESLYHQALNRSAGVRAEFLAQACGDDESLRREVESLLAQPSASAFLETPAAVVAAYAGGPGPETTASFIGQRLGSYTITSRIGAGGMGEVYRARDGQLGRDVAIKILPRAFATDGDRLARFEREARMLATLNHPHIASIYGVEKFPLTGSGQVVPALVLELVEGPTLADMLAAGRPLPLTEALAVARQIADALAEAHGKGLVHRDLKPANVKVTPAGVVKVLDFGLAKAVIPDGAPEQSGVPTVTAFGTREGVILGTPAYMSPEQARGQTVDKRADLWAFGCVLFEMLTGRLAFHGDSVPDTLSHVLTRSPDWTALPAATPEPVRRLLRRCLEKDRQRRLESVADARLDIDDALQAPATDSIAPAPRLRTWLAVASLLLAAAVASVVYTFTRTPPAEHSNSGTRAEAVTNEPGFAGQPALSPDGRLLAYSSDRSGRGDLDIWVQQTGGGVPLRLTDDESNDQFPSFSPDGNQIAFRSERNGGGVYIVPALGGASRLVAQDGRDPRFSPDGSRIAYWTGFARGEPANRLSQLYVVSLAGGSPVRLMADFQVANTPVWAPDGRSLLVIGRRDVKEPLETTLDWWLAPLDGGTPVRSGIMSRQDLRRDMAQYNAAWSGPWTASGFLVTHGATLLLMPLSSSTGRLVGEPRTLASGVGHFGTPTMSRDGDVMFSAFESVRVIQRLPLGASIERPAQLYADNSSSTMRASTDRDGSVIVLERVTGGRQEIWARRVATGEQRLIVAVQSEGQVNATVSPDGSRISYVVPDDTTPDFGQGFTVEMSGGVPRSICEHCSVWGFLPDGRAIVTDRSSMRLVADGAGVRTVLAAPERLDRPSVSPDMRAVAFRLARGSDLKTYVAPLGTAGLVPPSLWIEIDEPTTSGRPCGWSPDSSVLYLLLDADGFRDLWGQKVDRSGKAVGKPYVVRHMHDESGVSTSFGNAISVPGFVYEASRFTGNIWRIASRPPG